jgi:hypothetical protein
MLINYSVDSVISSTGVASSGVVTKRNFLEPINTNIESDGNGEIDVSAVLQSESQDVAGKLQISGSMENKVLKHFSESFKS